MIGRDLCAPLRCNRQLRSRLTLTFAITLFSCLAVFAPVVREFAGRYETRENSIPPI
jgi:hypothetical protein